jgi:hypothetical protein
MLRSRAHPEDLVPQDPGLRTLKLKVRILPKHRRALAARLHKRYASDRDCIVAIEKAVAQYFEGLEVDDFALDLAVAVNALEGGR